MFTTSSDMQIFLKYFVRAHMKKSQTLFRSQMAEFIAEDKLDGCEEERKI